MREDAENRDTHVSARVGGTGFWKIHTLHIKNDDGTVVIRTSESRPTHRRYKADASVLTCPSRATARPRKLCAAMLKLRMADGTLYSPDRARHEAYSSCFLISVFLVRCSGTAAHWPRLFRMPEGERR